MARKNRVDVTMAPEQWQRLKPLYEALLALPLEARAQFIEKSSIGDESDKRELEKLLNAEYRYANQTARKNPGSGLNRRFSDGQLLRRRFQIVRHLGSGGMGEVYEARDQNLLMGRVSLKVIRQSIAANPALLGRFQEEVILARRVSGPYVCRIHEFFAPTEESGEDSDAFITMEYLDGTTLSERIETGGAIPFDIAAKIAGQLCSALQAIHDAGVIHRDLKPRNIMLVPNGTTEKAVVMDFGLAHLASQNTATGVTPNPKPGGIVGTPEYMAPEQFEEREVTPATDIYALGLVLYEMVTGKQLFAANTAFAAAVRRGKRPQSASSVQRGMSAVWDDVIAKCLEFEPECRYQSATEVMTALSRRRLVVWKPKQGRSISIGPRALMAIATICLLVLAVVTWFVLSNPFSYRMNSDVKYWYDLGVNDLGEGTYLNATAEFKRAIELDKSYPLTHARLAQAWNELDYSVEAQQEMLKATAPEQQSSLSKVERIYVDAVRCTLIGDFDAAIKDYEAIQKSLPRRLQSGGLVDLGAAFEKNSNYKQALGNYQEAARLDPNNPAALIHLGILKNRLDDPAGAGVAFSRAEAFYKDRHNQEGIAELNFRRGYAANEQGKSEEARLFLNKALVTALTLEKSEQLQARIYSQLSDVEYNDASPGNPEFGKKAVAFAEKEKSLAEANGLAYWATDSLRRLGNAYFVQERYSEAEVLYRQGLTQARQRRYTRLEAFMSLSLSSDYDQEGKNRLEQIQLAHAAQDYFVQIGDKDDVVSSSELIVRAQEHLGQSSQSLQTARDLLVQVQKSGKKQLIAQVQEMLGNVLGTHGNFPEALDHYLQAVKIDHEEGLTEGYDKVGVADTLWHLGRLTEAQTMLDSISPDERKRNDIGSGISETTAQIQLSRRQFREALETAQAAERAYAGVTTEKFATFDEVETSAELQLNHLLEARRHADDLATLAQGSQTGSDAMKARSHLASALVDLQSHSPQRALEEAKDANRFYAQREMPEERWQSLALMAKAAKDSGDNSAAKKYAVESLDFLASLEHTWDSPTITIYESRPDNALAKKELLNLRDARGVTANARK